MHITPHGKTNMRKLDESKIKWIINQKAKRELTNAEIAQTMKISVRWIQKLWAQHRHNPDKIIAPKSSGRPRNNIPGRQEHSCVLNTQKSKAVTMEEKIEDTTGIHIPHNTIHGILRDEGLALKQPKKSRQRKWVRYERKHSNSLWHTDYKQIHGGMYDGKWFVSYQDDASRLITGFGVFEHETTENALSVLEQAIKNYGKPTAILSDHGSQFYANAQEAKAKGISEFEKRLAELDIKHILARVNHPQTNGKLERFHGELARKLIIFEEESIERVTRISGDSHVGSPFYTVGKQDPVQRFITWYNEDRFHMSLNRKETPAKAFVRKMASKDTTTVIEGQTGEEK